MDVKYIPSDWEKMRNGIGDLIGKGRLGKGMIDALNEVSDNLEEAEASIAKYDSDGVISFQHKSQKSKYQNLYEDFEVLYRFTGKVGGIVDRTIDQPFYDDMDAFVEAMRDLSIANYTTKNRLGITETFYATDGLYNSTEVEKAEVSLEDLFSGDNLYAKQMHLEYEEWKKLNPDQDFSGKEYKQAALSGRAFEYKSIRDQQENKESLVQMGLLGATIISAGITFFCPPSGLALLTVIGAASGAMEVKSAVTGKDWVSGRELGTGERTLRGAFGALDVLPGLGSITKFSGTVRLTRVGEWLGQFGLKTGVKGSFQQGISQVDNLVKTAGKQSAARLKSAAAAIKDVSNAVSNKLIKDGHEIKDLAESGLTNTRDFIGNLISPRKMGYAFAGDAGSVHVPVGSARAEEHTIENVPGKGDGVKTGNKSAEGDFNSSFKDFMSPEDAARYDEYWNDIAKEKAIKVGSEKTWNDFIKYNPSDDIGCSLESYIKLIKEQSPWPEGYNPMKHMVKLKEGDTFYMVLDNKQNLRKPGGFGLANDVPSVEFARNDMAIKANWKEDCGKVVQYRVKPGVVLECPSGPVGPQIDLVADKYLPGNMDITQYNLFYGLGRIDRNDFIEYVKHSLRKLE